MTQSGLWVKQKSGPGKGQTETRLRHTYFFCAGVTPYPFVIYGPMKRAINMLTQKMDQTASQNQGVLWNLRERCKDSDLDCHFRVCAGDHSQETLQFGSESPHNSTDFKSHTFREDAHFTGCFEYRLHNL